jgi:hypothetical protein
MKRQVELDTFTRAYIECALWSSTAYGSPEEKRIDPDHQGNFDQSFEQCGYNDLTREAERKIIADCQDFQLANAELLTRWYTEASETPERAGMDFWLTRNRHGAGFWDRWNSGTPQGDIGTQLTAAAHAYGECDLFYSHGKVEAE